jgi:hypothetical protein
MSALKITEAGNLPIGLRRTDYDALKAAPRLHFESTDQGVCGFADRHYKDACESIEVVEVLADAQHAMVAMDVTRESSVHAGLSQGAFKDVARGYAHLDLLALVWRRHGKL